nr:hypothetical protein [uncultured Sphingobacterium sp.]
MSIKTIVLGLAIDTLARTIPLRREWKSCGMVPLAKTVFREIKGNYS